MTADDEVAAVNTVVLGFSADPVTRWVWPRADQYLAAMPMFVRAFGGNAFARGGAYCTTDFAGAALWLPPGVHPDGDRLDALMESTARQLLATRVPPFSSRWRSTIQPSRIGTCR